MHHRPWALLAIVLLVTAYLGDPPEMFAWAARFGPSGEGIARLVTGMAGAALLIVQIVAEHRFREEKDGRHQWPVAVQLAFLAGAAIYVLWMYGLG